MDNQCCPPSYLVSLRFLFAGVFNFEATSIRFTLVGSLNWAALDFGLQLESSSNL